MIANKPDHPCDDHKPKNISILMKISVRALVLSICLIFVLYQFMPLSRPLEQKTIKLPEVSAMNLHQYETKCANASTFDFNKDCKGKKIIWKGVITEAVGKNIEVRTAPHKRKFDLFLFLANNEAKYAKGSQIKFKGYIDSPSGYAHDIGDVHILSLLATAKEWQRANGYFSKITEADQIKIALLCKPRRQSTAKVMIAIYDQKKKADVITLLNGKVSDETTRLLEDVKQHKFYYSISFYTKVAHNRYRISRNDLSVEFIIDRAVSQSFPCEEIEAEAFFEFRQSYAQRLERKEKVDREKELKKLEERVF